MKPLVFVTRRIPEEGIRGLKERFRVKLYRGTAPIPRERLVEEVKKAKALIPLLTDGIDEEVLQEGKELVVVANYAVGYDNIDLETATKLGIAVTNTPGVLTEATAELTWALILSASRHIPHAHNYTLRGRFKGWDSMLFLGVELQGKTLGVLGAGRIGSAVARKAPCFGMSVIYTDTRPNPGLEKEIRARRVDMDTLLRRSDVLSIHVPLTPLTRGLIGEEELKKMKRKAILVNTSRGPIVKESALIKAIREGWIFGAGLDVYEEEPLVSKELTKLDRVVLLPHIGSATFEARTRMAKMASLNVIEALSGRIPPNLVNREVLTHWRGREGQE